MNDLISVLVPIYGVEKYIERCAISLFEQTYSNIEYIFVNDCTPDNSIKILNALIEKYPKRKEHIKIIQHIKNQGLAVARNTALENASGKYVMHVDSDDYIDVTTIEKALSKMHEENADVVIFAMNHVFSDKIVAESINIPSNSNEYAKKLIARESPVCMCGGLYLRSLYIENHVRAVPGLNMGEDYATKPRVVYYARKVAFIDEPLYNYVHYNESAYSYVFSEKYIDNLLLAIKTLEDFFTSVDNSIFFEDAILKAKNEIWFLLLTSWGLHRGSKNIWKRLRNLYDAKAINNVTKAKQLMIKLAFFNLPICVRIYAHLGVWVKKNLK